MIENLEIYRWAKISIAWKAVYIPFSHEGFALSIDLLQKQEMNKPKMVWVAGIETMEVF